MRDTYLFTVSDADTSTINHMRRSMGLNTVSTDFIRLGYNRVKDRLGLAVWTDLQRIKLESTHDQEIRRQESK